MMSFNVMGACVVVLVHFSRSRRVEERMALKKSVKKEEGVKKEEKVKVKKEDKKVKKEEEVKVKKEEGVKVKKEKGVKEEEEEMEEEEKETDEAEKRENNDIKQNDSAIKHCDSFFTMLLEGNHLSSHVIVESENLVRQRHGY